MDAFQTSCGMDRIRMSYPEGKLSQGPSCNEKEMQRRVPLPNAFPETHFGMSNMAILSCREVSSSDVQRKTAEYENRVSPMPRSSLGCLRGSGSALLTNVVIVNE
ncbi:hypothetical protein BaRGS_00005086 [Batillaria attramentaria]|uniref:Uncharacterized protein n=1 Tax=Batillaria attramentaria TaxID=370345 RepID=A0ABD0LX50_9CAEN